MFVLWPRGKDRKYPRDKPNIGNPEVNKGCPSLTANPTLADYMEITFGPSIQHIPLGVYCTGGFNAMWPIPKEWILYNNSVGIHHETTVCVVCFDMFSRNVPRCDVIIVRFFMFMHCILCRYTNLVLRTLKSCCICPNNTCDFPDIFCRVQTKVT